jgi:hypothetical protein
MGWLYLGNGALREILEPKRNEVAENRREMHNVESCNLYFSSNIIKVIKSRRMGWAEDVACMKRGDMHTEF